MKEEFNEMVIENGDEPLAIIQGTCNRYFLHTMKNLLFIIMLLQVVLQNDGNRASDNVKATC